MKKEWIDISHPLNSRTAVWPGDTPYSYQLTSSKEENGVANVGEINLSCHAGTHIDAPYHFNSQGKKVLNLNPDIYIGKARLIDVREFKHLGVRSLAKYDLEGIERLLLKSGLPDRRIEVPEKYLSLDPDIGSFLREKGIILIGMDMPSPDPVESSGLSVHHAFGDNNIHILENAMLEAVVPGDYELIALPLALEEADGSPVRAVLRPLRSGEK